MEISAPLAPSIKLGNTMSTSTVHCWCKCSSVSCGICIKLVLGLQANTTIERCNSNAKQNNAKENNSYATITVQYNKEQYKSLPCLKP